MILVTERDHLLRALSNLAGIVDSKNTIPILSNVLMSTTDDGLKIRATNGDMEASELIDAHVGENGTVTVTASVLRDFVRNLPEGSQVSFKLGDRLAVSSGRSRINLGTLDPASFPSPWSETWATEFEIEGAVLNHMLSRVSFAQEDNVSRTYLMGVRLESSGTLRLIATNGAMLPYVDGPEAPEFAGVTMPTRMVTEALRMTAAISGAVTVGMSDGKISLTSENSTIISKLLDKSLGYPDYGRVIPKNLASRGSVNIAQFISAIRRAMISAAEGKNRTVRISFNPESLAVNAHNSTSDAMDEIDLTFDGEPVILPFNPDLMIEMLQSLPGDTAEFECGDPKTATIWRAAGNGDGICVAMPQRVGT
jgi:DNA polymerase-3 subunit beta